MPFNTVSFTTPAPVVSYSFFWDVSQLIPTINGEYSIQIVHRLGYNPSVTVKSVAGEVVETEISYDDNNTLTLTMAQPISGYVYLS